MNTYAVLLQALRAHLPASRVRAWILSPRRDLNDVSPAAYVSRAHGGIQAIMNTLDDASPDAPGAAQPAGR